MKSEFWLQRWREGRTGWHRDSVMPLLEQHWPALAVPRDTRVLVPLCGKSLDMPWLAAQGLRVLGVELAPLAIERFFAENHLQPQSRQTAYGTHYFAANIEIIHADIFKVDPSVFADCGAIYDRAAMIALPLPMRERYVGSVYDVLPADCRGLLITLEYPQHQMQGPPFSVEEDELRRWFETSWDVDLLERRNILASQPSFSEQGVTSLSTTIYRLLRGAS